MLKEKVEFYSGYQTLPRDTEFDSKNTNGEIYIVLQDAFDIITNKYNKRNPEVINHHKKIGIEKQYTLEACTLNPIINHLSNNNIKYQLQYSISKIKRRIDLFVPTLRLALNVMKMVILIETKKMKFQEKMN